MKQIDRLEANEIFVFGSNEAGAHGAGAAYHALSFGATMGQGRGWSGKTYAIPTKDGFIRTLTLEKIQANVNEFIDFAREHSDLTFVVTPVGCGLAGYKPVNIAPLFKEAMTVSNIMLPEEFKNLLV